MRNYFEKADTKRQGNDLDGHNQRKQGETEKESERGKKMKPCRKSCPELGLSLFPGLTSLDLRSCGEALLCFYQWAKEKKNTFQISAPAVIKKTIRQKLLTKQKINETTTEEEEE